MRGSTIAIIVTIFLLFMLFGGLVTFYITKEDDDVVVVVPPPPPPPIEPETTQTQQKEEEEEQQQEPETTATTQGVPDDGVADTVIQGQTEEEPAAPEPVMPDMMSYCVTTFWKNPNNTQPADVASLPNIVRCFITQAS